MLFVRYVGQPPTQEDLDILNEDLNYKINTRSFGISKSKIKIIGKTFSIERNQPWDEYYYKDKLIETNEEFTVLDMDVHARYFSNGYSRGNILYLCSIAEWIEYNFTEFAFEILYGMDMDNSFILFDGECRRKLKNDFYSSRDKSDSRSVLFCDKT